MSIENIDSMTMEELKAAQAKVAAAIEQVKGAAKGQAEAQVAQWLADGILSQADLTRIMGGGTGGKKARKAPVATAWVDPQNEANRYSGRGKLPEWLRERFAANGVSDDSKARAEWLAANLRKAA